ncbi:MAG: hypothetical protein ACYDHX_03835 [Methanothrix sp.]
MTSSEKFRRLAPFEECAGSLKELFEQDGALIALIGKIHLSLPTELEQSLRPLIGQTITILRINIPEKPYLFRVLAQEKGENPSELESGLVIEENGKRQCDTWRRCYGGDDVE